MYEHPIPLRSLNVCYGKSKRLLRRLLYYGTQWALSDSHVKVWTDAGYQDSGRIQQNVKYIETILALAISAIYIYIHTYTTFIKYECTQAETSCQVDETEMDKNQWNITCQGT